MMHELFKHSGAYFDLISPCTPVLEKDSLIPGKIKSASRLGDEIIVTYSSGEETWDCTYNLAAFNRFTMFDLSKNNNK